MRVVAQQGDISGSDRRFGWSTDLKVQPSEAQLLPGMDSTGSLGPDKKEFCSLSSACSSALVRAVY